jgi:hypothetical protein
MTNAELLECIRENRVLHKLKALQDHLKSQSFLANGPDESRPQDPCLWVRGLSKHFVLQIIVPPKAGNSFTVNLRPVSENPHSPSKLEREAFEQFAAANGLETRNHGAYSQLDRKIPIEDPSRVVALIGNARRLK